MTKSVLVLLATAASAVVIPGAVAPAAASEPCPQRVIGDEMPDGADPHPLISQLGLYQAWDLSTGAGVTVAVIDSGVDAAHPDLDGAVVRGSEFTTVYDEREFVETHPEHQRDCVGHGTAVAGLVAARRADDRMTGVAPDATIYPVRLADGVGEGSDRMLAAAIDDAIDAGADVINLSLADPNDREPVRDAIQRALDADIVVVAAVGNEGNANVSGGKMYPAAYDGVLGVGAVGIDGQPLDESNAGDWVDIAAIGEDVVLVAPGGEGYRLDSGTSFAAAQVSGAAALVRSRFPELSAEEVAERLTASATPLGGGPNDHTGAGLVDPFGALTSMDGPGNGDGGGDGGDGAAGASRIPVRPLPQDEPLLGSAEATGLAVSGVLLLAVLLGLLAAPGVRRAARRGWRAGTAPGQSPPHGPPHDPPQDRANAPDPPAASLAWLGGSGGGGDDHQTANPTRNRTP
jgi:type VII secretion-associated serine protease mycosin